MNTEQDTRAVVERWRNGIKSKERRIFRFDERLELRLNAIQERIWARRLALDEWQIRQAYYRDIGCYDYIDADWRAIRVGETWGGEDVSAFFKRRIEIPNAWAGLPVVLRCYLGGDSLISLNGVAYQGLDPFSNEVWLNDHAQGGQVFDIVIESYVTWHAGESNINTFQLAELGAVDKSVYEAYWDLRAASKMLMVKDLDDNLRAFLEECLWDALKQVPLDGDEFKSRLLAATEQVRKTLYTSDRFRGQGDRKSVV